MLLLIHVHRKSQMGLEWFPGADGTATTFEGFIQQKLTLLQVLEARRPKPGVSGAVLPPEALEEPPS